MGISDELRDLAATPPEATALSASLADQAIGFAVRARRVAHMKVAAAVSAVTIAAAGVGIGIVTSNNDSELPTTTPVVTITSTPSGSPSSPQSPSSQEPSSAPVLEQSPAPQQPVEVQSAPEQTTGPEPEKNIVERIIDTLASIPQWVIDQFTHQDQPADPGQTTSPSVSPEPSSTSPSSAAPGSPATPDQTCTLKKEWRNGGPSPQEGGSVTRSPEDGRDSVSPIDCGRYRDYLQSPGANGSPTPSPVQPGGTTPVCTLIVKQDGSAERNVTVPCEVPPTPTPSPSGGDSTNQPKPSDNGSGNKGASDQKSSGPPSDSKAPR